MENVSALQAPVSELMQQRSSKITAKIGGGTRAETEVVTAEPGARKCKVQFGNVFLLAQPIISVCCLLKVSRRR
jgi:hypothetical protein